MLLHEQYCEEKQPKLLTEEEQNKFIKKHPQWKISVDKKEISRTFRFKDYYQTLLFINTVADIAHRENHHPDIKFGYNTCTVNFSTLTVGGITLLDMICAAHIEQLLSKLDFKI